MLRVVMDTNVLVAALASPTGMSRRLVMEVLNGRLVAVVSTPLLLEYEAVLTRPDMLAMSGLARDDVIEFLDDLSYYYVGAAFDFQYRPIARDPNDDLVFETALNGGADVIATFNVADFLPAAKLRHGGRAAR